VLAVKRSLSKQALVEETLKNFHKQFLFEPFVVNGGRLKRSKNFLVGGMGGSHLGADLLKIAAPTLDFHIHQNYGLPDLSDESLSEHLLIAISYSGNTEETLSFAEEAHRRFLNLTVVTSGGELLSFAESNEIPHVKLPSGVVQRLSLGYQSTALAKLMHLDDLSIELRKLAGMVVPESLKTRGKEIAEKVLGKTAIIYSSAKNQAIAYNWKIGFNETSKSPAFYNTFPELNHNEMEGFTESDLSSKFCFLFLVDESDDDRIKSRMKISREIFEDKGFEVEEINMAGGAVLEKTFNTVMLGHWSAFHLSNLYGRDPEQVPMIEEFKKRIT
jgi:glucose/mannose-6-phosphate isomerase